MPQKQHGNQLLNDIVPVRSIVHSHPMTDVIQLEVNWQIKLCQPSSRGFVPKYDFNRKVRYFWRQFR